MSSVKYFMLSSPLGLVRMDELTMIQRGAPKNQAVLKWAGGAARGRLVEERLEEGERRALLKAMGVEIWRLRAPGEAAAASGATAGGASAEAIGPGTARDGAPSEAKDSSADPAAAASPSQSAAPLTRSRASESPGREPRPTLQPAADTPPRCEIHAYKLGRVLVLADADEPAQQNRRLFQDLVRAAGGDPDRQRDPTEFVWPPAEGSLFDAGQDAALAAFAKRMRGRTANVVTLCVGESVCEIVRGLDLGAPVVFAGALQTLRTSPEAKRNLWQSLQGTLEA
jgi:hypothetical protein